MSEARLYADLAALGVVWSSLEHEAVFTVDGSEAIHAALPGAHTKNLFLKNADGSFWLVTVDHAKRVDLKGLAGAVGAKKFSFGKPEDMERLLGVTPGAVTPLAVINDADGAVRVVIDADLVDAERVHVHPLRNTATIGLSGGDLLRALEGWNHSAIVSGIPERP
ncbi:MULTISPECIES: prolyl-tRNA synthetase associated domain-containing protein [unclassified Novosphingobium]|uniref:prolyl-tRNA synthetase associated domain-containing protein n=1 Tax=unclassified Novosphingobium TaxID=2644732 RepID=UPI000D31EDD8|nr:MULTISPECIES: prolyl-tRNA synthetase associated domain-containing protein [unclassified Novosphingobium]PTR10874.1 Ala-tRNA(Pro) deacylase [Novosphingobium sp. GV055]PUB03424.1 Ala-tRNA(Pro) deacylase [Novosphingobium sp. GV061]PUB19879.1 Ala-tRNA(Pro) deacylase [Novosphingobium sp. GV079]PUB41640.1 Ala-tRNA(Pro) deacylase [Novosphingobium sp. GV027]